MNIRKAVSVLAAAATLTSASAGCSKKKDTDSTGVSYTWSNVAIGGGGYITGIVYNPKEEGLAYVRTDIGGAYRYDKSAERWVPITDQFGGDEWNLIGIESIATDPVEPNRVYAACGTYTMENGAIIASDDYGKTWKRFDLSFGCGGNLSGRGVGERLMVDPTDNKNVYFGSRSEGLWRSSDYGETWEKVESFPVKGDFTQEATAIGIMWVISDPSTGDIYAGAAMTDGKCIYKSADGGASWEALPALPAGMYPLQAEISTNGKLYTACSDNCGPNADPKNGAVYAIDLATGDIEDITPDTGDGHYGGYGGISLDEQDPDTLVVTSLSFWHDNGDNLYRTTDGGATWSSLYTSDEKNYVMDTSEAQWLDWGRSEAKTGWWTAAVAIDPHNSDEVSYGTGATLFATENLTDLGSGTPVTIKFHAQGIEETAVFDMRTPLTDGSTPQMYSIMGDLTGFAHMDVNVIPDDAHFMKNGKPVSVDCAWQNGNYAVYTTEDGAAPINYTTDGGVTWGSIKKLPEKAMGGYVSMSADGSAVIWKPSSLTGKPYVTYDFGETWYNCDGLGYGARITADRVNPKVFYASCNNNFYVSKDGGHTFESTGAILTDSCELIPSGTREGCVWVCNGTSVFYTEDGGQTFTMLKNITAKAVGFGAPEKEGGCETVYVIGAEPSNADDYQVGIYRSTDNGQSWVRLNDDMHLFGNITPSITGDPNVFGRVYFATNGRGIVMGDIADQ
ncbi:MAG: cellulose-binding protein [Ruminococcus sp.]|nr:cellulose-binding protein [Ruminococcus sp.]